MRAQQASAGSTFGGATAGDVGVGNNGYGDHMFPTQQSTGMPYEAPTQTAPTSGMPEQYELDPIARYQPQEAPQQASAYEMHAVQPNDRGSMPVDAAPVTGAVSSAPTTQLSDVNAPDAYAINMPSDQAPAAGGQGFFGQITNIQDMIRQIDQNVNRISDLHSRSLNNVGEAAQQAAESELTMVATETSRLTNSVKNTIKSLESEALKIPAKGPAPEGIDRNVRLTQIGAAKNRFKETILRYQEVEKAYRSKYRQRTERQLRIVKPDATQEEIQGALDGQTGGEQIFSQALLQSNRQGEARGALREVQERNTDIRRIEQTITELAALFQEMSILVEQQDEQLNVIKDNTQVTEQEIGAGRDQTDKAVVSARRARKRRWICFFLFCLLVVIVIVVVVPSVCHDGCGN